MSSKLSQLTFTMAAVCIGSILNLVAQEPGDRTETARPARDPDAVIERVSNELIFAQDGTGSREQTARIRIQSQAALQQLGVLRVPYRNDSERVDSIEIQVRKPDGRSVITPSSNIQDLPSDVIRSAPTYSDLREKQVPVKSLSVGDILEFHTRIVGTKAEIPGHFWFEHSFVKDTVVLDETLRITVPRGKYVKVSSPASKPEIQEQAEQTIYAWKWTNREIPKLSDGAKKPAQHPRPDVQLTTFRSWEEVGRWYDSLQTPRLEATEAVRAKAIELTAGLKTNEEKQRAIYQFVSSNFRYIAISFGQGRYQPHAADEVLANQYGDCKDKHTLLAAFLRALGIEAWPVLIGAEHALDPDLPSPAQFNHVITYLPQADSGIWLDSTPGVAPYRMLLAPLRDHAALLIPRNSPARIVTTPADPPFPAVETVQIEGKLGTDGTLTAHFDFSERGDSEILFRGLFHAAPPAQWSTLAQNLALVMGYGGTVKDLDVSNPLELEQPFHFSYDYERKNYSDWENRRFSPPFPPFSLIPYDDSAKPTEPVDFGVPSRSDHVVKMQIPAGYSVEIPGDVKITTDMADYKATYSVENGILSAQRTFVVKQAKLKPADWAQYQRFAKNVVADEERLIQLVQGGAGVATSVTRDVPDAAELVRKAWAAVPRRDLNVMRDAMAEAERINPQQAGLWSARGAYYGLSHQLGLQVEAFEKELEYHPGTETNYKNLAMAEWQVGRKEDAIATCWRWVKMTPESLDGVTQLVRYLFDTKKYKDAIAPIQTALKAESQNTQLGALLAEAFLRSGQKEAAVAQFAALQGQKLDSNILNSLSWALAENDIEPKLAKEFGEKSVAGFEDQLKTVTLASLEGAQLRPILGLGAAWDTLGWVYFRLGDLGSAEKYVTASWMLLQHAVAADHLGQIYERQGKKAEAIHAYRMALAVNSNLSETRTRLQHLGGSTDEWPAKRPRSVSAPSTVEEVSLLRTTRVPQLTFKTGTAEFFLLFSTKGVEDGLFINGDENLKGALDTLKKQHYNMPFPDDGPEKIARRGILSCSEVTTPRCSFVFLLPENTSI
jgi:transglutaminase-like putative cysteine protease/tetratricopeptide (TPR) repeat protein